mgnify:CR=1 FL=1
MSKIKEIPKLPVEDDFEYNSGTNPWKLTTAEMKKIVASLWWFRWLFDNDSSMTALSFEKEKA